MTTANQAQRESWNGESGDRWVASADERDAVLAPVADALLTAADLVPGMRVLDVGCGCGATTLAVAARVGPTGTATGIDLAAPMLEVARERAAAAQAANATFVQGDAQDHAFEPESSDLAISRFGTMFFEDPVAAFANIATALRPGGRICLATWRPLDTNEWLVVPRAALLRHADAPATSPDGPGMFGQSDPGFVTETLTAAGLTDVHLEPVDLTFTLGASPDDAMGYLVESGPGRLLLETIPDGTARQAALADVRDTLADHTDDGTVQLGGAIWLISAARPPAGEASDS